VTYLTVMLVVSSYAKISKSSLYFSSLVEDIY
jgi:hypothetical protein